MCPRKEPRTSTVLDEHTSLRALLGDLEDTLSHPPECADRAGWLGRLGERLEDLRGRLRKHFTAEEEGGFFGEIQSAWPSAASRCQVLMDQHGTLLGTLDELLATTIARPTADVPFQSLIVRTCSLIKDLLHHEQRENELHDVARDGGPEARH